MQADLRGQYNAKTPWIQHWTNQKIPHHTQTHQATKNKSNQRST